MGIGLVQTTGPSVPPVTQVEAKAQLRISASDEDDLIDRFIEAARQYCEDKVQRQFITATWTLYLREFPLSGTPILLPRPPLQSVTSVKYIDTDGDQQTWDSANYRVTSGAEPGEITEAFGVAWPSTRDISEAVEIAYKAGYGDAATAVDHAAKQAMLLLVDHYDKQRGETLQGASIRSIPKGVDALLGQIDPGWRWSA